MRNRPLKPQCGACLSSNQFASFDDLLIYFALHARITALLSRGSSRHSRVPVAPLGDNVVPDKKLLLLFV